MFGTDRRRNNILQMITSQQSSPEERGESDQPSDDVANYEELSNPISLYDAKPTTFLVKIKNILKGSQSPFGENRLNHLIRLKKRNQDKRRRKQERVNATYLDQ